MTVQEACGACTKVKTTQHASIVSDAEFVSNGPDVAREEMS